MSSSKTIREPVTVGASRLHGNVAQQIDFAKNGKYRVTTTTGKDFRIKLANTVKDGKVEYQVTVKPTFRQTLRDFYQDLPCRLETSGSQNGKTSQAEAKAITEMVKNRAKLSSAIDPSDAKGFLRLKNLEDRASEDWVSRLDVCDALIEDPASTLTELGAVVNHLRWQSACIAIGERDGVDAHVSEILERAEKKLKKVEVNTSMALANCKAEIGYRRNKLLVDMDIDSKPGNAHLRETIENAAQCRQDALEAETKKGALDLADGVAKELGRPLREDEKQAVGEFYSMSVLVMEQKGEKIFASKDSIAETDSKQFSQDKVYEAGKDYLSTAGRWEGLPHGLTKETLVAMQESASKLGFAAADVGCESKSIRLSIFSYFAGRAEQVVSIAEDKKTIRQFITEHVKNRKSDQVQASIRERAATLLADPEIASYVPSSPGSNKAILDAVETLSKGGALPGEDISFAYIEIGEQFLARELYEALKPGASLKAA